MTCRDIIEFLIDYVSEELPANERAIFDKHLAECPPCADYLNTYMHTMTLEQVCLCPESAAVPAENPEHLVQAILEARRSELG